MTQDFTSPSSRISRHAGKQGQMRVRGPRADWLLPVCLTSIHPERPVPLNLLQEQQKQNKTRDRLWQAAGNLMGGQNKQGCSSSPTVELRWFEYKRIEIKEPRTESSPSFQQTCLRMWPLNPDILLRADWTIQVQAWYCDTETDRQRR